MSDRNGTVTRELSVVRTVLDRAETALAKLKMLSRRPVRQLDPDGADMIAALHRCVDELSRWRQADHRRTGSWAIDAARAAGSSSQPGGGRA